MKILALDPSTKMGYAHSCGISGCWDLSTKRDESKGMRLFKLRGKLQTVLDSEGIDLLVFESARNAGIRNQGALVVQAELQGVIKLWCEENAIEYRGYSPAEIKKHAFSGKATKQQMIDKAKIAFDIPDLEDDNQADALWLLSLVKKDFGL